MSVNLPTTVERSAENESLPETVVWAVADAKGVDPMDIDVPLYDSVDPDALERLFGEDSPQFDARLTFTLADCDVVIRGDRTVVVRPPNDATAAATATAVSQD
ncbi:hypothetical protein G9464_20220 [Halostella sp. JP-L12]|uniref:HalOD1 output domain-containing protein n=1 Tax=Halostella TaxID=1843185 RepID=UPI000EF7B327|nr:MULTISPECIES: HalOD1 output domain-containing protein [Halostella]NHN49761.1 hypothetical protein [Halostella sp. JP-L12]NHN49898.1 hypothetical protein [Halostella sp. JP-L12]